MPVGIAHGLAIVFGNQVRMQSCRMLLEHGASYITFPVLHAYHMPCHVTLNSAATAGVHM